MDTEYIVQLALSLSISICMAIWFIVQQTKEYHINMEAIEHLKNFFSKKEGYSTYDSITVDADTDKSTKSVVIKNVANDDAEDLILGKSVSGRTKRPFMLTAINKNIARDHVDPSLLEEFDDKKRNENSAIHIINSTDDGIMRNIRVKDALRRQEKELYD